jgi:DNA-binding NarL/FixJ family response regulator
MENLDSKDLDTTTNVKIYLIDDEPIFRVGFSLVLQSFPQFYLVDFDNSCSVLEQIANNQPQLIIIEFKFLPLAKTLISQYPNIPICLLTAKLEPEEILAIQEIGIKGYAPKNIAIDELIKVLTHLASGRDYWYDLREKKLTKKSPQTWLSKLRKSGLNEINSSLTMIDNQLKNTQSLFDQFFWQGRKRELLVAKWLVKQLLPVEFIIINNDYETNNNNSSELVVVAESETIILFDEPIKKLFLEIEDKLKYPLENNSNYILEIDILNDEKKQELLQLIWHNFQIKVDKIRAKITKKNIQEENWILIKDIWQGATIAFFTENYEQNIELTQYQIIEIIKRELPTNFQKISQYQHIFSQILNYLGLQENIRIGTKIYNYDSSEALEILGIILETLIIMIGNATMEIILNNFGEESIIQEKLYHPEMISLREIARFRNSLSFRYFRDKYLQQPQEIFEGEYHFLKIENDQIIIHKFIQINRKQELNDLTGIRWFVTIILECRDAISPLLRAFIGKLGQGLIFILTQVIGKGIGLIGRGIFEGLGNSLPKTKANKKNNNNL